MPPGKNSKSPKGNITNGIGLVHRRNHQLDPETKEITIWELGNPLCLVNILPERVGEAVKELSPEMCSLSEFEHKEKYKISEVDELLRISFWDEYFQTCDELSGSMNHEKMRMDAVYPRVCSRETFYHGVVSCPHRLAFLIKPPRGYMLSNRSLLEKGYQKFREILELPLIDVETGKPNSPLIGQIIKMVVLLENRVRGSVAHQLNINQQSLVANVTYEAPKANRNIDHEIEQADKEIAALSEKNMITDTSIKDEIRQAREIRYTDVD